MHPFFIQRLFVALTIVAVFSSGHTVLAHDGTMAEVSSPCPATLPIDVELSPSPSEIPIFKLNEVLPDPQGDDAAEFIEIVNRGITDEDASGWSIVDASEKKFTIQNVRVAAGASYSFIKSETKLALNNGGERLRLLSPSGAVIDEAVFDATGHVGAAFARDVSGMWAWTIRPTPGSTNVIEIETEAEKPAAAPPETVATEAVFTSVELKNEDTPDDDVAMEGQDPNGPATSPEVPSNVTAMVAQMPETTAEEGLAEYSGLVTVAPGRLSKATLLLLDDAGRGFVVRLYGKDGSPLRFGDRVTLRGRLHENEERPWISARTSDITVTSNGAVRHERRDLITLSSDDHALPVEVKGTAVSFGERWVRITDVDGLGEIKATLPIDGSLGPVEEGSEVTVKGVVRSTSQGLELVLLSRKQLTVIAHAAPAEESVPEPPAQAPAVDAIEREPLVLGSVEKKEKTSKYAGFGLLGAVSITSILYWRKKKIPLA